MSDFKNFASGFFRFSRHFTLIFLQCFTQKNFVVSTVIKIYETSLKVVGCVDRKEINVTKLRINLWFTILPHKLEINRNEKRFFFVIPFAVHDEPREIQLWVANVNASSFISLAVRGHSLYRLNYPLAMKKWHHMCTSWNGKTGEWQLWVSSERVGRGFYNRVSTWLLSSFYDALKLKLTLKPFEHKGEWNIF